MLSKHKMMLPYLSRYIHLHTMSPQQKKALLTMTATAGEFWDNAIIIVQHGDGRWHHMLVGNTYACHTIIAEVHEEMHDEDDDIVEWDKDDDGEEWKNPSRIDEDDEDSDDDEGVLK